MANICSWATAAVDCMASGIECNWPAFNCFTWSLRHTCDLKCKAPTHIQLHHTEHDACVCWHVSTHSTQAMIQVQQRKQEEQGAEMCVTLTHTNARNWMINKISTRMNAPKPLSCTHSTCDMQTQWEQPRQQCGCQHSCGIPARCHLDSFICVCWQSLWS